MWRLYKLLGKSRGEKFLVNELLEMIKVNSPEGISAAIQTMYGDKRDKRIENVALMFIDGVKGTGFFDFQFFIGSINVNK